MIRVPLAYAAGTNTDETSFSMQNRCIDSSNARWRDGKPEPDGGFVKYLLATLEGVCRNVLPWVDVSALNIALGTNSHLYVHTGGELVDITPVGLSPGAVDAALPGSFGAGDYGDGYYGVGSISSNFPATWSLATWAKNLIANRRGGGIYAWDNDPMTPAEIIPNAPTEVNAICVTAQRQILAFGCTKQLTPDFDPLLVRGCDLENRDVWTSTTSNNAFGDRLEGGGSRLVNGEKVGNYIGAWTDQGLFMGTYTGDSTLVYQWDLQGVDCGLIGPNAVVIVNQRAYWITPDRQFYTWAPGEAPAAIACPIRSETLDHLVMAQADKISGVAIGEFGEVMWTYPDDRDGAECSRYVRFTTSVPYGEGLQWSKGIQARTAAVDAGAVKKPLMVSPTGTVYSHEDGNTADGGPLTGFYTISLPTIEKGGRFVRVKGMEPDFRDQLGAVTLELALRKYPQASTRTGSKTITIAPGAVRKDFLVEGRSGEARFSWASSPAYHRPGEHVLTVAPTGRE